MYDLLNVLCMYLFFSFLATWNAPGSLINPRYLQVWNGRSMRSDMHTCTRIQCVVLIWHPAARHPERTKSGKGLSNQPNTRTPHFATSLCTSNDVSMAQKMQTWLKWQQEAHCFCVASWHVVTHLLASGGDGLRQKPRDGFKPPWRSHHLLPPGESISWLPGEIGWSR